MGVVFLVVVPTERFEQKLRNGKNRFKSVDDIQFKNVS